MKDALKILFHMGSLRLLFPLWCIGIVVVFLNPTFALILAILYGVVVQFVVEYVMHRFLYHRDPPVDQSDFNALYRTHIGHHEFPNDPEFFTGDDHWFVVKFGVVSVALHSLALWPFLGLSAALIWAVVAIFVGSISAFAFYEYCHTLAHLKVPKGWFGQRVTQEHMLHHFHDHQATFHVSAGMGWIDAIFGTRHNGEIAKERFDRETILSLGMDPEDLRLVTARKAFGLPRFPKWARRANVDGG